jgi:glycosyltransferase involved in cell wall biosynthesis
MRIAYLSQTYPPMVSGAAIVADGLARGMSQRGHQVLVLAASDRQAGYQLNHSNLTITRFHSYPNPLRANQRFALWPGGDITAALHKFAPDVIHAHDPLQFGLSALRYGKCAQVPVILTAHQLPWFVSAYLRDCNVLQGWTENVLWAYASWLLRRFNHVIAPTHTIAEIIFSRTDIAPSIIGYGIDPGIFYPGPVSFRDNACLQAKFNVPEDVPILLHVGRLDMDKRADIVIHSVARAMADNQSHLIVVGDGTEKLHLMRLCYELGIGERCHFLGFVTPEQGLANIYRLAYAFITASEIETQGLVLLEAAACGLPIVAVRATCIPEIVKDDLNGWLVAPGDVHGLSNCIKHLLDHPEKARSMGQAGTRVVQSLELGKSLDEHESLYLDAIKLSRQPGFSPGLSGPIRAKHSVWSD